jgi:hypothetical protein
MVAGQQVDRSHQGSTDVLSRHPRVLGRNREIHATHRRHERRAVSCIRQERKISILHREHGSGHGCRDWWREHERYRETGNEQRLCDGLAERPPVPSRSGEPDENKPDDKSKPDEKNKAEDATDAKKDAKADAEKTAKDKEKSPPKVSIDLDRINQRILALPIPARNYAGIWAGKEGLLFLLEFPEVWTKAEPPPGTLYQFDLTKRKVDKFLGGILAFDICTYC